MLLTGKSFCFLEINTWPLPPKNFTILSQKMKRSEQCKFPWVDCKYYAGFCSEFTKITVFFLQNYRTKIHSWTGQMLCHMFKIIWSVSSSWFGAWKWNIFPRKRFVVRWSHSDFLTTAAHIGYLADSSFRMILKRTECFWLPNLFVFLR